MRLVRDQRKLLGREPAGLEEDSVADLQESVRLSNMRYQGGTITYLEVLDGQRSLFAPELTLSEARGNEYQSLVQLYRSLGGGWQKT